MKRKAYLTLVAIAFLLGILHSTLTFVPYKGLNTNALWFLGTGLALLFYGALNLITQDTEQNKTCASSCASRTS